MAATTITGSPKVLAANAGKRTKRRIKRTCGRQVEACEAAFFAFCESGVDCEPDNLERFLACCSSLANCDAGASLECAFSLVNL